MYHKYRWTPEKIQKRLNLIEPLVYIKRSALPSFRYLELVDPAAPPPVAANEDDSSWLEIGADTYWGRWVQDFVLRTRFVIPEGWDRRQPIALFLPLGDAHDFCHPEALAYVDGIPFAACDRNHQEILLKPEWADGREHLLVLHGWTGLGDLPRGDPLTKLYTRQCQVVQVHPPTREFISLATLTLETVNALDENNPVKYQLLNALDDAFNELDIREPLGSEGFYASVVPALQALKSAVGKAGDPLDVTIHAAGHAHIDVAWLWTLAQTRRKAERTFHTIIRLMERYPEQRFSQTQPQLYQFIKEDQPALFEAIRKRVHEGRWEPLGGMWVEADCNISGAESLARQFLLGRTFFRENFGTEADSPILWLPDVFGYPWTLPQLIQQAGMKYFMTIKLSWNQYNRLPYDTFLWQGLDGSQVLTHFSTVKEIGRDQVGTYSAMANAKEALGAWQNFQQKELHSDLFMAYGFGDGGGGPTREMLENIELMKRFPGLPQVRHSSMKDFFASIAPLADSKKMPIWNGELYLEYHRGTYTTQARSKRANRKSEFLLHDAELIATLASQFTNYQYPISKFTEAWRAVCLNQFHDIIPGSSIGAVYEESLAQYAELERDVLRIRDEALHALSEKLDGDLILVNPTPFPQRDLVFVPDATTQRFARDGKPVPAQQADSGCWLDVGELQSYGVTALSSISQVSSTTSTRSRNWKPVSLRTSLENELLLVEFNSDGDIARIFDKHAKREILPPNAVANQFQAFVDRPKDWDAWDVDIFYDDKMWLAEPATSMKMVEYGELRKTLEIKRRIQNSEIAQRISLNRNSPRLDFDTRIDWQERHVLLKVAFPVDILAPQATYEIQWGSVERPTHRNTSWDWARFESCAHKWVDLSEGGYGVSLLNDCKYGHDIHNNVMRITLLRSPTKPDPLADFGEHHFKYSLYPHAGSWGEDTQREAYLLNDPIVVYKPKVEDRKLALSTVEGSGITFLPSLVTCDSPNIIVETVKRAEDGDGIIVRLYESQRQRKRFRARFGVGVESAWVSNLLEESESALSVEDDSVSLNLKPYQIVTLRVKPRSNV